MKNAEAIKYLDNMEQGKFLTIKVRISRNQYIPVTAMFVGKDKVESLPMGTYELEEAKTINGLVLNDKKYEIKFEQEDLVKKIYEVNEDISNDTTLFEFSKKDIKVDNELEGAELSVIDENDNIIDTWTSTKEPHIVNGLEENQKYKLVEITAPYGYELTEEIEFVVTTDKETQLVEMKDMPILKNIKLKKQNHHLDMNYQTK